MFPLILNHMNFISITHEFLLMSNTPFVTLLDTLLRLESLGFASNFVFSPLSQSI